MSRVSETELLSDPTLSSYREQLVEYSLLTELLQDGWFRRRQQLDVLHSEVDGSGYDLVVQCGAVTRHIQLKSSISTGKASRQNVHVALARQTSGAVVWVVLSPSNSRIELDFLVFGGAAGEALPSLTGFSVAKHTKGDSKGQKGVRKNHRVVPKSQFRPIHSIDALSDWLFGPPELSAR